MKERIERVVNYEHCEKEHKNGHYEGCIECEGEARILIKDLAAENQRLREALKLLLEAKRMKDTDGKSPIY